LPNITIQRIPFSAAVDNKLRMLKARTGITPNILCRLGFCLSLEERGVPTDPFHGDAVGREINRYTLLGEYDTVFASLLKTWAQMSSYPVNEDKDLNDALVGHMNRGAELLSARVRTLVDLQNILPREPLVLSTDGIEATNLS
jgi:DNA sulfur modification protein DndE